jgi:hypothetical protein
MIGGGNPALAPWRIRKMKEGNKLDEEQRTTHFGLFYLAHTYAISASQLRENHVKVYHRDYPVRFLYTHSIELYLKAFLRMHEGFSSEKLRKLGHKTKILLKEAEENGLLVNETQRKQIGLLNNYMDDRYWVFGARTVLKADAQHELCRHLHEQMAKPIFDFAGFARNPIPYEEK